MRKEEQGPETTPKSEFVAKLEERWEKVGMICVGLDPEFDNIPEHIRERYRTNLSRKYRTVQHFCLDIVDATHDLVCAFKLNTAFYEKHLDPGVRALHDVISYIHRKYPDVLVILDGKRGDVEKTTESYRGEFEAYGADAVTVNPYAGRIDLQPFLNRKDKGVFVWTRSSGRGAIEFQDSLLENGKPLYQYVAEQVVNDWNVNGNCGLIVGMPAYEELKKIRRVAGDIPILAPGIGSQGGLSKSTVVAGENSKGFGLIMSSSSDVIFASGGEDFAQAARNSVLELKKY